MMGFKSRAIRGAAAPLRNRMDRAGINRNYCVAGFFGVAGCAVFVVFTVFMSTGVCHNHTCPEGQEESLLCNCNIFRWIMGAGTIVVALALMTYECRTREGREAIMAQKSQKPVTSQRLLDGSTNV